MMQPIVQPRSATQQSESWRAIAAVKPIVQPRAAKLQIERSYSNKPFNTHDNTCMGPSLGGNGWGGVGN